MQKKTKKREKSPRYNNITPQKPSKLKFGLGIAFVSFLILLVIALAVLLILNATGVLYGKEPPPPIIDAPVYSDKTSHTDGTYDYVILDDGTAMIKSCNFGRSVTMIDIPAEINGIQVTAIGDDVFFLMTWVTRIILPDSITYIGHQAFYGCCYLDTINLPSNLKAIQNDAFKDCDYLASVTYDGTRSDFEKINIGSGNTSVTRSVIFSK